MELGSIKLTWTKLDSFDNGTSLYLCNEIVARRLFDQNSSSWASSNIRHWLNNDFIRNFTDDELKRLAENADKDKVFLLSRDEYEKYQDRIPSVERVWWLRSPGYNSNLGAYVNLYGSVCDNGFIILNGPFGVRPAILVKK